MFLNRSTHNFVLCLNKKYITIFHLKILIVTSVKIAVYFRGMFT